MRNFYHLKSTVPAYISINGEKKFTTNLDIISIKNFYIAFFPLTNDKYSPCAISSIGDNYPQSITKIPFKDNHIDILFNPAIIKNNKNEVVILNKKYMNTIFTITNSNSTFINITSNSKSYASTTKTIQSIEFKTLDNFVIITGIISNEEIYMLIYNTKTQKILIENIFNKLEKTKTSIKALKKENSISGYGKVVEFDLSAKKINNYNVYSNSTTITHIPEIIPLCFLECIKYKDFKKAKDFLDNPTVSDNHFINFFDEIKDIYFNGYSNDINYTISTNKGYKNFTFVLENNKIIEIEENNLNLI